MGRIKIHVVFGVDCKVDPTFSLQSRKRKVEAAFQSSHPEWEFEVQVHCHSLPIALAKIFESYRKKTNPSYVENILSTDVETQQLFKDIKNDLERLTPEAEQKNQIDYTVMTGELFYDKVLVYGFSFGGAMVNEVSLKFSDIETISDRNRNPIQYANLEMATFGSVFLTYGEESKEKNTNGCHTLVNYMAKQDVMLNVNNFNEYYHYLPFPSVSKLGKNLLDEQGQVYIKYVPLADSRMLPPRVQPICIKECENRFRSGWSVHFAYSKLFYGLLNRITVNIAKLPDKLPPRRPLEVDPATDLANALEEEGMVDTRANEEETKHRAESKPYFVDKPEPEINKIKIDFFEQKLIKEILDGKVPEKDDDVRFKAQGRVRDLLENAYHQRYITKDKLIKERSNLREIGHFKNCEKNPSRCMQQTDALVEFYKRNKRRYSKFWRPWFTKKIEPEGGKRKSKRRKLQKRTVNRKQR